MHVAHFIQRYPPALGGSESYFARLSRYLAAHGHRVSVFTSNAVDLPGLWSQSGVCLPAGEKEEDGVQVRRYPLWYWPGRRWLLKALSVLPHRPLQCLSLPCNPISFQMWRNAHRSPNLFNVVHAAAFPYAWPIVCGLRLARRCNIPFFLTPFLHLGDPENRHDPTRRSYTSPALVWLLSQADLLFAQTPSERSALLECGIPEDKIIMQGLGVDPAECTGGNRHRARHAWGVDGETILIGHLANNSEEKGTVDLLRAAAFLWERGVSCRIVLAGPEMPNFQRFWKSFAHKERVIRLGVLDDRQKRDFFAAIDVFALPSRSDSFGLVLLEAWANGVPNVAYRAGGVADVIRDEEDGLLVRCGDVPALAQALGRFVQDPSLRMRLGESGKQKVIERFRWEEKLEIVRFSYLQRGRAPDTSATDERGFHRFSQIS